MDFNEYLTGKKIDPAKFKAGNPEQYSEFERHFSQMHPASITAQKLFLINIIRRTYLLEEKPVEKSLEQAEPKKAAPAGPPRPKMIPKIKR